MRSRHPRAGDTLRTHTGRRDHAFCMAALLALVTMLVMIYSGTSFAAGDPVHGETVYKSCSVCHSFDKNGIGPRHRDIFGNKAGSVADYQYSDALRNSQLVWDEDTLSRWLANPQALVPGAKMFFMVRNAQDRADVIEFLKEKKTATP